MLRMREMHLVLDVDIWVSYLKYKGRHTDTKYDFVVNYSSGMY